MSKETIEYLNTNTLIGFTSKRGNAWHYKAADQGEASNHYEFGIPVEDVNERLFHWTAVEGTITASHVSTDDEGFPTGVITTQSDTDKAIMRSDTGAILGIFKQGYKAHQYQQWLIENVGGILDANLQIGSAGVLKGGAQAWVQIEMPETMEAAEGVKFRPFLTAATSMDGSMSTTYLTGAQVVVCDNTLSAALGSSDTKVKIKHSTNSLGRLADVRAGLELVFSTGEDFQAQVDKLTSEFVSDAVWKQFVHNITYPGPNPTPRSKGMAERKVADLSQLWNHDERVAPWKNNAYGVVAAVNTWEHHLKTVKGASRADRNAGRVIAGQFDDVDASTLKFLAGARS